MKSLRVIDSHTEGEATRVVLAPPDVHGDVLARRDALQSDYDWMRAALTSEPRGFAAMVGAYVFEPDETGARDIVFFNNRGYLNMCVHGTIGVVMTLGAEGLIEPGEHRFNTPAGEIAAVWEGGTSVRVRNVPSYHKCSIELEMGDFSAAGDIAWGGNWFFVCGEHGLDVTRANIQALLPYSLMVLHVLQSGEHPEVDHVELFGPPTRDNCDATSFVLCPGGEFDRSPCGTGTSAKVACLAASGALRPGEEWRQEGILGTRFVATYEWEGDKVIPTIEGSAWITGHSELAFEESDPFPKGIRIDER